MADRNANTYTFSYDGSGRLQLTAVTTPLGDQTTYAYNAAGDETAMTEYDHTSHMAATTTMTYDALHRVSTYEDALFVVTSFTYDQVGNEIQVIGPNPDNGPRAARPFYGCGCGVKCMAYDAKNEMISETDSMNHTTSFTYDGHGNRTSVTDPNLRTTTYTYDLAGNLLSVTDPDGNTTTYRYDDAGRLRETMGPNNDVTSYFWDAANRLQYTTDPNNQTRSFSYDAADRLTTEQWLNAAQQVVYTATYGYNAADLLTSASDPSAAYTYSYDASNRLISDSKAATPSMPSVVLTYGYDGLDNVTSLQDNISISGGTGEITFSYDADHHLTGETWLSVSQTATQIANVTLHYDGRNRLDQINRIASSTGAVAVNTAIGYNADDLNRSQQ